MAEFPALPLWTDAYLGDTAHLTNEEHGVYLRLLMFAWRAPTCSLPDDDRRLAIMTGLSEKKWRAIKPTIQAFWDIENGAWTQKRLTKERDYVRVKSGKSRDAALARWNANALKSNETDNADALPGHMLGACQTDAPIPIPIPSKKEEAKASLVKRAKRLSGDWFLPRDWGEWALQEGMTSTQIRAQADTFKDYWIAKAGKDAAKTDWQATWRNWCRKFIADQGKGKINGNQNAAFGATINAIADDLSAGTIRLDNSRSDPFAARQR